MERYFTYLTRLANKDEQIEEEITKFDPLEWLNTREFDNKKKDDYLQTMIKEWNESKVRHGCYETMVKSGEVYYTDETTEGLFMGGDDRPRNIMVGSKEKHGAATYMQAMMHPLLKRIVPGYI